LPLLKFQPSYKGGKITEVVVNANFIGLRRFYRYVVNIGMWSPYEGGHLDRFHCTELCMLVQKLLQMNTSVSRVYCVFFCWDWRRNEVPFGKPF